MSMNAKQERFVNAVLGGAPATEAAIEAGYSPARARAGVSGSELMKVREVAEAIRERRQAAAEAAGATAEEAIQGVLDVARHSKSDRERLRGWSIVLDLLGLLGPVRDGPSTFVDARSVTTNITSPEQARAILRIGLDALGEG